jgi:hypothetical protein
MEVIAACILTAAFAVWQASEDDLQITMGQPVRHVRQWLLRASVVTLMCVVIGLPWLAIGLAGLFSAVFRYSLNRLRGLSPWYVSPSNWYDWFWLCVCAATLGWSAWGHRREFAISWSYNLLWPGWVQWSHRAGRIAYAVELVVFVAVLLMHVL